MESRALAGYTGLKLCYLTGKDFIERVLILFLHPLHKGRGWGGGEKEMKWKGIYAQHKKSQQRGGFAGEFHTPYTVDLIS